MKTVMVNDAEGQVLENTRPGKARRLIAEKLIAEKKAVLIETEPPLIKLRKIVTIYKGGTNMDIGSINKYFAANKNIFVHNVSGTQISLTFYRPDGRSEPFTIPNTKIPICITQYVPFSLVIESTDFRRMVQRRPPRIKLLTEEEYTQTITSMARVMGASIEDLEKKADEAIRYVTEKLIPVAKSDIKVEGMAAARDAIKHPVTTLADTEKFQPPTGLPEEQEIKEPGVIGVSPKVLGLCMKLEEAAKAGDTKVFATDMIMQMNDLSLTAEDLHYLIDNAVVKRVKKWATEKLSEVSE